MSTKYSFEEHGVALTQRRRHGQRPRYPTHGSVRDLDIRPRRNRRSPAGLDDSILDAAFLTLAKLNDHNRYLRSFMCSKHDMGRSPGSDGIALDASSIPELAKALRQLAKTIADGTFVPNDHRHVQLPKPKGKFRTLSIPVFAERVVARSFNNALLDVLDARLPNAFHAYRRNRGILTLLAEVARAYDPAKPLYIGTADIENAFPSTQKQAVEEALQEYVPDEALRNTLLQLSYQGTSQLGLPQGLATSPTLFTIMLSHCLAWGNPSIGDDNTVLTYSDNLVYVSTTKESIMLTHEQHKRELEDIGMRFKADQPLIPVDIAKGNIEILGTTIHTIKGKLSFRPGIDGWDRLIHDIRNTYPEPCPSDKAKEVMLGWISHNRHIVHSFGAEKIGKRLRTYCSNADIHDIHWDSIDMAVTKAINDWREMVKGIQTPIPPEPEIWQ